MRLGCRLSTTREVLRQLHRLHSLLGHPYAGKHCLFTERNANEALQQLFFLVFFVELLRNPHQFRCELFGMTLDVFQISLKPQLSLLFLGQVL